MASSMTTIGLTLMMKILRKIYENISEVVSENDSENVYFYSSEFVCENISEVKWLAAL